MTTTKQGYSPATQRKVSTCFICSINDIDFSNAQIELGVKPAVRGCQQLPQTKSFFFMALWRCSASLQYECSLHQVLNDKWLIENVDRYIYHVQIVTTYNSYASLMADYLVTVSSDKWLLDVNRELMTSSKANRDVVGPYAISWNPFFSCSIKEEPESPPREWYNLEYEVSAMHPLQISQDQEQQYEIQQKEDELDEWNHVEPSEEQCPIRPYVNIRAGVENTKKSTRKREQEAQEMPAPATNVDRQRNRSRGRRKRRPQSTPAQEKKNKKKYFKKRYR